MNDLKNIEVNYKVQNITCNNHKIWPYIRIAVANELNNVNNTIKDIKPIIGKWEKIKYLMLVFYGFLNLFKSCENIIFATSKERKKLDASLISKNIHVFYKYLKSPLLVEHPYDMKHYDKDEVYEKNIISLSFIHLISKFVTPFIKKKLYYSGQEVLDKICKDYHITCNLQQQSLRYLSQYYAYKWFLRMKKPKNLFISVYYGYGPVVKAAKDLGIKVIEIQHGIIHAEHYAYIIEKKVDVNFYPDICLVHGEKDKKLLVSQNVYYEEDSVHVMGNYYLEKLSQMSSNTSDVFKGYQKIVSFSSSLDDENYELSFLSQAAQLDKTILYLFLPRRQVEDRYSKYEMDNLKIIKEMNCNEILNVSTFHSTINSTCSLEAAFCGLKCLFVNLGDNTYFINKELKKFENIFYQVNNVNDFVDTINSQSEDLIDESEYLLFKKTYYKDNVENNIYTFLLNGDFIEKQH